MTPTLVTLTPDPAVAGKPLSVTVPGSTSARPRRVTPSRPRALDPPAARVSPRLTRARACRAAPRSRAGV